MMIINRLMKTLFIQNYDSLYELIFFLELLFRTFFDQLIRSEKDSQVQKAIQIFVPIENTIEIPIVESESK